MNPLSAVIMAAITGVGGGVIRDVLMLQVPTVLRSDFNASASMLGGLATVMALRARQSTRVATWFGIITCFAIRMLAVYFHWHLPRL